MNNIRRAFFIFVIFALTAIAVSVEYDFPKVTMLGLVLCTIIPSWLLSDSLNKLDERKWEKKRKKIQRFQRQQYLIKLPKNTKYTRKVLQKEFDSEYGFLFADRD